MQTVKEAYFYEKLSDEKVRCRTCNRICIIPAGKVGFCQSRENRRGILYTLEYGLISSLAINQVEKKPFFHFYPGSQLLTVGSWSCTFTCPWCQNYEISKTGPQNKTSQSQIFSPSRLVKMAQENHCRGMSMSFSEPTTFLEYAVDVFTLARKVGLCNTVVTNGYFTAEAAELLCDSDADAFNIDIKGDADAYKKYCMADSKKVWQNVERLKEKGVHIELTTLIIPGVSDDEDCLRGIARRIKQQAGPETPWHISRYFPAYRFSRPPTPIEILERAYQIGKEAGLLYVYLGNVPGHRYENTYCPTCQKELINRNGYPLKKNLLQDHRCPGCGTIILLREDIEITSHPTDESKNIA